MHTNRMSIEQIALLLDDQAVRSEIIEELQADPRVAVARLLQRRQRRITEHEAELRRLRDLHQHEMAFHGKGRRLVAGVDEAGRGPLAGPVVVAAVILPPDYRLPGLNDSKKLSAKQRETLYTEITSAAIAVTRAVIDVERIDRINIYQATLHGMYEVLAALRPEPEAALIDAMPLKGLQIPCLSLIHGDAISASIAAASIVAKVERDRIMDELDSEYPLYGFAKHKGYATPDHLVALEKYGPCPMHRKSFSPIKTWGALFSEDQ